MFFFQFPGDGEKSEMGRHNKASARKYNKRRRKRQQVKKHVNGSRSHLESCTLSDQQDKGFELDCSNIQQLQNQDVSTYSSGSNRSLPPFVDSPCDTENLHTTCTSTGFGAPESTRTVDSKSSYSTLAGTPQDTRNVFDRQLLNDPLYLKFKEFTLLSYRLNKVSQ